MKLHFTGSRNKAGSWKMRGVQVAQAGGWTYGEFHGNTQADALVIIKRIPREIRTIRKFGVPIIFDALDFWKQPDGDTMCHIEKFKRLFDIINPNLVICTNTIMAQDVQSLGYDTHIIPHHYDPSLGASRGASRKILAYWGHVRYLGDQLPEIKRTAEENNYELWINPPKERLREVDKMFALREAPYNDYYSVQWKSNVKQATAQRLRVPFWCPRDASYEQFKSDETVFNDECSLDDFLNTKYNLKNINDFSVQKCVRMYRKLLPVL